MSVELKVYLRRAALPTGRSWAHAVNEAGFAIAMDHDFDTTSFEGYLPCTYQGAPSGFEYNVAPSDQPDHELVVTLASHGDESELACSAIAAGVLCTLTNGMLYDPQSDGSVTPDEAIDWVNEIIKQLGN